MYHVLRQLLINSKLGSTSNSTGSCKRLHFLLTMYVAYGLVIKLNLFIIADSYEQIDIEITSP